MSHSMTAQATPGASRLLSVEEACEQLGIRKRKIYELMGSGELASIKLPPGSKQSGRRIEQSEIDAFIERNRVAS